MSFNHFCAPKFSFLPFLDIYFSFWLFIFLFLVLLKDDKLTQAKFLRVTESEFPWTNITFVWAFWVTWAFCYIWCVTTINQMFLFTFVDEKKNQRGTRRILGIYSKPRKSWPVHCTKWKKGQKPFQVKESRYCSWLSNLMKETCRCDPCWCDMPDDGLSEWRSGGEVRKGKNNKKKVKSVFHIHRGCHIGFTENAKRIWVSVHSKLHLFQG